jgi:hypothetical protein
MRLAATLAVASRKVWYALRDGWHRWSSASKFDFAVNLVVIAARAYQVYLAYALARPKLGGDPISGVEVALAVPALVIPSIQTLIPRFAKKRWITEDVKRARSVGVAVSRLAAGIRSGAFSEVELHQVFLGLLTAIRSQVEALVADTEGIHIKVCLVVPDPQDETRLLVLSRSDGDRRYPVSYPREDLVAWSAIQSRRFSYSRSLPPREGKEYKCIIAYPILSDEGRGNIRPLGSVSIDSTRSHHFDGLEGKMETRLLPYIQLLQLSLICHERHTQEVADASRA